MFLPTGLLLLTFFSVLVYAGCSSEQPNFPSENARANEQAFTAQPFEKSTILLSKGSASAECSSPGKEGSPGAYGQCAPLAEPAPVPDVVGMKAEAACRRLLRGDWMAYIWGKREAASGSVELGRIVAQKPKASTVLQPQGIFLLVSKPFPDVLPQNTHCASRKVGPID